MLSPVPTSRGWTMRASSPGACSRIQSPRRAGGDGAGAQGLGAQPGVPQEGEEPGRDVAAVGVGDVDERAASPPGLLAADAEELLLLGVEGRGVERGGGGDDLAGRGGDDGLAPPGLVGVGEQGLEGGPEGAEAALADALEEMGGEQGGELGVFGLELPGHGDEGDSLLVGRKSDPEVAQGQEGGEGQDVAEDGGADARDLARVAAGREGARDAA